MQNNWQIFWGALKITTFLAIVLIPVQLVLFDLRLCIHADIALDEVADDQHGMSASTLNLGTEKKVMKLSETQKVKTNSLKTMDSQMASLGSKGLIQFPTYPSLPYLT